MSTSLVHVVIICIAMLEGGAPKVPTEHGYLHITDRALKDYNTCTHLNVTAKELDNMAVSDDVAATLITKVWCPGETDIIKIGKRYNGKQSYGIALNNLVEDMKHGHGNKAR